MIEAIFITTSVIITGWCIWLTTRAYNIKYRGKTMEETKENKEEVIIAKVWKQSEHGAKVLTVPKRCHIQHGDYVKLVKI